MREAVRKRVDETSLREVADEVGMSFSGLRSFLDGGSPHRATIEKLMRWYSHTRHQSSASPREDIEAALALVLSYLRDESKPRAVRERRRKEVFDRLNDDAS